MSKSLIMEELSSDTPMQRSNSFQCNKVLYLFDMCSFLFLFHSRKMEELLVRTSQRMITEVVTSHLWPGLRSEATLTFTLMMTSWSCQSSPSSPVTLTLVTGAPPLHGTIRDISWPNISSVLPQVHVLRRQVGPVPDVSVQEPHQAGGAGHARHLDHPQREQQALLHQRHAAQAGRLRLPRAGWGTGKL